MRRRDILLQSAVLPVVAAFGATARAEDPLPFDGTTVRNLARGAGAACLAGAERDTARPAEESGLSAIPFDPLRSRPCAVARTGSALHRRILPSRLSLQAAGQDLRGRQWSRRAIRYSPDLFTFGKVKPPPRAISASPAFACTTRSIARTITTRSARFSAPATSARWRRVRAMACRRADWRSRPPIPPAKSFRCSATFWLERPGKGSDAIVVHALLDSQSAAAAFRFTIRPGQANRVRYRDGAVSARPTSPLWASRRSPRCSCSTATIARGSMTIARRCTIPMDCCCRPARASRSGVRLPIRASCRSAPSPTAARAASG